jgi:hypothetical protein
MKTIIITILLHLNLQQVDVKQNTNKDKSLKDKSSVLDNDIKASKGYKLYMNQKLIKSNKVQIT